MRIVTSGSEYLDIDAYGGCIAYAELLRQGFDASAVSSAPLNESISKTVRSWEAPLETDYQPAGLDSFTLVDVSDPKYFDKIVSLDRVDEVIDHHPNFENYWQRKIGAQATIDFIGAACTLVYEKWVAAGLLGRLSVLSSRLLTCGILDNTLNFGAKVTSDRDRRAYKELVSRADLPADWASQYFDECEDAILADVAAAISKDSKLIDFKTFQDPVCVGQLVVWDSSKVLADHRADIQSVLSASSADWFMNLVDVERKTSLFLAADQSVQDWLSDLLSISFESQLARADRLWLRKEIIKQDASRP